VLNQPLPSHPQNAVATVASDGGVRGNIFGSNLGRLQQIKAKYDPNNAPGQQGPSKHNSFFSSALMSDESKRSKLLDAFFSIFLVCCVFVNPNLCHFDAKHIDKPWAFGVPNLHAKLNH